MYPGFFQTGKAFCLIYTTNACARLYVRLLRCRDTHTPLPLRRIEVDMCFYTRQLELKYQRSEVGKLEQAMQRK